MIYTYLDKNSNLAIILDVRSSHKITYLSILLSLNTNILKITIVFFLYFSDKIVYTRQVPDTRDPRCQVEY